MATLHRLPPSPVTRAPGRGSFLLDSQLAMLHVRRVASRADGRCSANIVVGRVVPIVALPQTRAPRALLTPARPPLDSVRRHTAAGQRAQKRVSNPCSP